jgi:hypothetical protein
MTRSRMVLIAILAILGVYLGYDHLETHLKAVHDREVYEAAVASTAMARALIARETASQPKLPRVDLANLKMPTGYPRPASEWFAKEKQFHQKLLEGAQYEVLVAPLQVEGYGFDRATREVMTAELATAIQHSGVGSVLDPFLLSKALGDDRRQFAMEDLYRIADSVGAKRIVFGFVGHDANGKMTIGIASQASPAQPRPGAPWPAPVKYRYLLDIAFDDEHPAIDAFEQRIPDLLKSIGMKAQAESPGQPVQLDVDRLPASPRELVRRDGNAASSAYGFILLGLLTPGYMEETRAHFAAKAFAAVSVLSAESPEFKALRARSYMLLGYRSAALRCLGPPSDIEEQELLAALNGNLADVRRLALQERNPTKHLISTLDANRIAADFELLTRAQSISAVKALGLPGPIWAYLVGRAATDWDVWSQFDNGGLKSLLDQEFPREGSTLQDILRGAVAVGGGESIRTAVDLSVLNHVHEYLGTSPVESRRFVVPLHPSESDYLELLAAIGHDNLMRRIYFLSEIQRQSTQALEEVARIESIYRGNPYFALVRAHAEKRAAERTDGAEQDSLLKAGYEDAFNAMYWEQGQSRVSSEALQVVAEIGRHEYGYFDNFYYGDLPYHPLYMLWGGGGNSTVIQSNGMSALRNATSEFDAVSNVLGDDRQRLANLPLCDEVGKLIADRFLGDPRRQIFLSALERLHGRNDTAAALLRDSIHTTPNFWPSYAFLGDIEFQAGRPQEAARVFSSYPGFKHSAADNAVAVANRAYDAGIELFGSGDFDLAVPLLRIAATQGSGAGAEMSAQSHLRLLQGDVRGAAALALERGQRYGDTKAFRDYLGMLHAANQSNTAWSGFNSLVRRMPGEAVWEAALVGHHREPSSEGSVVAWIKKGDLTSAGNRVSYAVDYLVQFATTDRIPSKELAETIDELDRPVWQMENGAHAVVRPASDGEHKWILGPAGAIDARGELPIGAFEAGKKHRVRSGLSYFVAAYRAIKLGEFASARKIFAEASGLYDLTSPDSSYMLPYYALAVARSDKDTAAIESILSRVAPTQQQFDYELALAAVEVAHGAPDQALKSLRLARYRRAFNDERPVMTQFTYGDICEELYEASAAATIRSEALDWAHARERAEPWQAWSYSLEVALAPNSEERKRAIAMVAYLDPQSAHLARLKRSEVDEAVKQFAGANIFLAPQATRSKRDAI